MLKSLELLSTKCPQTLSPTYILPCLLSLSLYVHVNVRECMHVYTSVHASMGACVCVYVSLSSLLSSLPSFETGSHAAHVLLKTY